jgi:hypothetical protein
MRRREAFTQDFFLVHLASAAFLAMSERCCGVSFFIRASALFLPPKRPKATAAGFFFFAMMCILSLAQVVQHS